MKIAIILSILLSIFNYNKLINKSGQYNAKSYTIHEKAPLLANDANEIFEVEPNPSFEDAQSINQGSFLDVKSYSGKILGHLGKYESDYYTFNVYANSTLYINYRSVGTNGKQSEFYLYRQLNIFEPNYSTSGMKIVEQKTNFSTSIFSKTVDLTAGTYYFQVYLDDYRDFDYELNFSLKVNEKHEIDIKQYMDSGELGYYIWESDYQVVDTKKYEYKDEYFSLENENGKIPNNITNEFYELGGFITSELYIWDEDIKNILYAYFTRCINELETYIKENENKHNNSEIKFIIYEILNALICNLASCFIRGTVDIYSIIPLFIKNNVIENMSSLKEMLRYFTVYQIAFSRSGVVAISRVSKITKDDDKFYYNNELILSPNGQSENTKHIYYNSSSIYDKKGYLFDELGYVPIYGECKVPTYEHNIIDFVTPMYK